MTPNGLSGSTLFAPHNEAPRGHSAPFDGRNLATAVRGQTAFVVHARPQSGRLAVTQVMCLFCTSKGLSLPMTSIKAGLCYQIGAF